jgi:2,5-diamino-6-(ribosylamino)-4(3H)-pyrimidinone 5'-phosphate reductase
MPTQRPFVICHMCTTIDGKVLGSRWGKFPGGQGSAGLFETTAATFKIPAWLVGTTTMREFMGRNAKLPEAKVPVPAGDFVADPSAGSLAIGVDAGGVLRFQEAEVDGDHTVILTTTSAGVNYLAHLRKAGVSYLLCGSDRVDLPTAMQKLRAVFKVKRLMLQGGGTFNGAMLAAGLVDEISQLFVPVVDGGGPSITGVFDAPGKPAAKAVANLKLLSHKKLPGGVQWFRYRVNYK